MEEERAGNAVPLTTRLDLKSAVADLLAEDSDCACVRESHAFEKLAGELGTRIVLFGAGGLGRRCLAGLRHQSIEPIAFADNNSKLWGHKVDGLTVLEPRDAARLYGASAAFVVTIWGALSADRMSERVNKVRALGCSTVIPFAPLFWKYPESVLPHYAADLPHRVLDQRDAVLRCFDVWADEASRQEYLAQLHWRLTFDFDAMAPPRREEIYFPPGIVELQSNEVFVDYGAFDGDTLGLFLSKTKSEFSRAFALEPDPANFAKLSASVERLPLAIRSRIEAKRAAVGKADGAVHFSGQGNRLFLRWRVN